MSQYIKKMDTGGPIETLEQERSKQGIFETASGKYDAKALAANFENNIDDYVDYIGMSKDSKDYERFVDLAARIQKGIIDGTFKRTEGKRYEGTIISDGNKYLRLALGLLDKVISASSQKPDVNTTLQKTTEKYDPSGLLKFFYNYQFGGQETPEFKSWLELDTKQSDGTRLATNRANRFAEMLDSYADSLTNSNIDWSSSPYGTKDEYQRRLRAASTSLRENGFSTVSKLYLNRIGIGDIRQEELFGEGKVQTPKDDDTANQQTATARTHAAQLEILKRSLDDDLKSGVITQEEYQLAIDLFNNEYKKRKYGIGVNQNPLAESNGSTTLSQVDGYQLYANTNWKKNINKSSVDLYGLAFNTDSDDDGADKYKKWLLTKKENALSYLKNLITSIYTGTFDPKSARKAVDSSGLTNQLIIFNFFFNQRENQKLLAYASDGKRSFYLKNSIRLQDGSIIRWNVDTNQFQRVYILPNSDSYITKLFHDKYNEVYPSTESTSVQGNVRWGKYGAKLNKLRSLRKLQSGGEADDTNADDDLDLSGLYEALDEAGEISYEEIKDNYEQTKEDEIKQKAANEHIDPEIIKRQLLRVSDLDDDMSFQVARHLRNLGTATSVLGLGCLFVPEPFVSKTASAILFGVSAAADFTAEGIDYFDGRTPGGEALANAIVTAVTTLGPLKLARLVQKGSALAGKALKWSSAGLTGAGAATAWSTRDNARPLFADGDDMTVEELKNAQRWWSGLFGTVAGVSGTSGMFVDPVHGGRVRNNILGFLSDPANYVLNGANLPGNNPAWRNVKLEADGYNLNRKGLMQDAGNPDKLTPVTEGEIRLMRDAVVSMVNEKGKATASELNATATSALNQARKQNTNKVSSKDVQPILAAEQESGDIKLQATNSKGETVDITIPKEQVEAIRKTYNDRYKSLVGDGEPSEELKTQATNQALAEAVLQVQQTINLRSTDQVAPFKVDIKKGGKISEWVSSVEKKVDKAFGDAITYAQESSNKKADAFDTGTAVGRLNMNNAVAVVNKDKGNSFKSWLTELYLKRLTGSRKKFNTMYDLTDGNTSVRIERNQNDLIQALQNQGILDDNALLSETAIKQLIGDVNVDHMSVNDFHEAVNNYNDITGANRGQKNDLLLFKRLVDQYHQDGGGYFPEYADLLRYCANKAKSDKKFFDEVTTFTRPDGTRASYQDQDNHFYLSEENVVKLYGLYLRNEPAYKATLLKNQQEFIDSYEKPVIISSETEGSTTPQDGTATGEPSTEGAATESGTTSSGETNGGVAPEPAPTPEPTPTPEPAPTPEPTPTPEPAPSPEPAPVSGDPSVKMDLDNIQSKAFDFLREKYKGNLASDKQIHDYVINNISSQEQYNALTNSRLKWNSKHRKQFQRKNFKRLGGVLNTMKLLRGGIVKAEGGDDTSGWDWYPNRFSQKEMLDTEKAQRNQFAGASIVSNGHNQAFDLSLAAKKNYAYISNPLIVGLDIQNYYNNHGNGMNAEEFVNEYNSKMQKLRDTWGVAADGTLSMTNWKLNAPHGMRDHNRLFKELYASRSTLENGPEYNIGYQVKGKHGEDVEDMVGSSSWMRRPDFYRVKFEQDTDEGKASRIHEITLGNGEKVKVYKKDNGDIAILPNDADIPLPDLLQPVEENNPVEKTSPLNGEVVGSTDGSDVYKSPKDKLADTFKQITGRLNNRKADMVALGRLLYSLRTNRRIYNENMKIRPALKSPLIGHMYVRDDFSTHSNMYNAAAEKQNSAGIAASSDANINNARMFLAQREADNIRTKADLNDAAVMHKTSEDQRNLDTDVYRKNVAISDFNNASLVENANAKHLLKASLLSANYTSLNNELMAREKRLRDEDVERKEKRELAIEDYKNLLKVNALSSDPIYILLKALLSKYTPGSVEWTYAYNAINNYRTLFLNNYMSKQIIEDLEKYGVHVKDDDKKDTFHATVQAKSGGVIDDTKIKRRKDDNQLLVKLILASIKSNEKALDRLSRSQLLSIRKILS